MAIFWSKSDVKCSVNGEVCFSFLGIICFSLPGFQENILTIMCGVARVPNFTQIRQEI